MKPVILFMLIVRFTTDLYQTLLGLSFLLIILTSDPPPPMKILELNSSVTRSYSDYLTSREIAHMAADSIYSDYLATSPFTDDRYHSFAVAPDKRVYLTSADEYTEYIRFVLEALNEKINANL